MAAYVPTLKTQYKEQIVPALMKEFGYTSIMQCPKLEKIVINQGMGQGNYTLGITEQIIFPEIDIDKITKIFGMEITFVTTAATDEEAYALLREFGLPFKNAKKNNQ